MQPQFAPGGSSIGTHQCVCVYVNAESCCKALLSGRKTRKALFKYGSIYLYTLHLTIAVFYRGSYTFNGSVCFWLNVENYLDCFMTILN